MTVLCVVVETLNQRVIGRHLSKVAQQVIVRGDTRVICVLGLGLEKPRFSSGLCKLGQIAATYVSSVSSRIKRG